MVGGLAKTFDELMADRKIWTERLEKLVPICKPVTTYFQETFHEALKKLSLDPSLKEAEKAYEDCVKATAEKFSITESDVDDILFGDPFDMLKEAHKDE